MNGGVDALLVTERQVLRRRMQAQRQLITQRLGPAPAARGDYPRSLTMRFLARHPVLTRRVLVAVASGLLAALTAARRRSAAGAPARTVTGYPGQP